MICKFATVDLQKTLKVINEAATVYKGKIPNDRWKIPYITEQELDEEIQSGVQFHGYIHNNVLVAVMGIQRVNDVTLIRHAHVLKSHQRKGFGEKLLKHLLTLVKTSKIYVGTWEAAWWAITFYQKHGFELVPIGEKNILLKMYWKIPERQIETSVVLKLKKGKFNETNNSTKS